MTRLPALGPRGEGWVVLQVVLLGVIGLGGLLGPVWDGPARLASVAAGVVLLVAGAVLVGRGTRDLRDNLTPLPHPRDGATLVEDGVYRHVRHPIYGGIVLGSAGWALATASGVGLGIALAAAVFFTLKSRREEAWLEARFPGYAAYRARTRRLIPWLY